MLSRLRQLVMQARATPSCNSIELHVTQMSQDGDSARVDLSRDETITMMRSALCSRSLLTCHTSQDRLKSSHIGRLTMERLYSGRERVESGDLLCVRDLRNHLPLVWLEWQKKRLPSAAFPCVMDRDDVRYCVRREVQCDENVLLYFETHMSEGGGKPIYRVWVEVKDLGDPDAVVAGLNRALDGLGINASDPGL